jgi:hypothetical protein
LRYAYLEANACGGKDFSRHAMLAASAAARRPACLAAKTNED